MLLTKIEKVMRFIVEELLNVITFSNVISLGLFLIDKGLPLFDIPYLVYLLITMGVVILIKWVPFVILMQWRDTKELL